MPQRTCGTSGCPNAHRAKGLCSSCYNRQHQPDRHRKSTITCVVCGETHLSSRAQGKYCSDACRSVDYTLRGIRPPGRSAGGKPWSRRTRARWRIAKAARGTVGTRWVAGRCGSCAFTFVSQHLNDPGRYCSNACKRRTKASRRRARKRSAVHVPYSRTMVFERDGYRCHLCKRMTKRDAVVPHPRAPVIDHLVPLGPGDDAQYNVATACFLCNSIRRDVGPAQLILFG